MITFSIPVVVGAKEGERERELPLEQDCLGTGLREDTYEAKRGLEDIKTGVVMRYQEVPQRYCELDEGRGTRNEKDVEKRDETK